MHKAQVMLRRPAAIWVGIRHQSVNQRQRCAVIVNVNPLFGTVSTQIPIQRLTYHALADVISDFGEIIQKETV